MKIKLISEATEREHVGWHSKKWEVIRKPETVVIAETKEDYTAIMKRIIAGV